MKYKYILLVLLIVLLGTFLRFYKLGEVPNGVYVDEAAIGYNAYSILLTGADEYGKSFPVFLRSFNAFSSPLYVYLSAVPVWLFGLSAYSVRFLSALSGVLTIPLIYLILGKFSNYKNKLSPLLGTLIFAVSPWHIFFSRGAFEVNLSLLLLAFATYLFLISKNLQKYFVIGVGVLAVATYAYHSLRLIPLTLVPLFALLLLKQKKLSLSKIIISIILFLIISTPQILLSNTTAFGSRAAGLFYEGAVVAQAQKINLPLFLSVPLSFVREFLSQFIAYFSPRNIFLLGDSDIQRSIPEVGLFYSWILPFYLVGLLVFFRNLKNSNFVLLGIMLVSFAVPAALARDPSSSLRALPLIIPFSILITMGIDFISTKLSPNLISFSVLFLCIVSLFFLWRGYFVLLANERAAIWGNGYQELSQEIKDSPEHFVIDISRIKPPHILMAFYLKTPPNEYQEFSGNKIIKGYYYDLEFDPYYNLGNFETRAIDWEQDVYKKQILVGDALALSEVQVKEHFLDEVFKIYDPLDQLVFQGYRTNPELKCKSIGANPAMCGKH